MSSKQKKQKKPKGKRKKMRRKNRKMDRLDQGVRLGQHLSSFPRRQVVQMRYVRSFSMASTHNDTYAIHLAANSIYRPFSISEVHDALGYDQWSPFYQNWIVIGSRISTRWVYPGADAGFSNVQCLVFLSSVPYNGLGSTTGLPISEVNSVLESGRAVYNILPSDPAAGVRNINHSFSAKKWFGFSKVLDNIDTHGGTFYTTAYPVYTTYYNIVSGPVVAGGTSPEAAISVLVTVEYLVMMTEPNELSQSVTLKAEAEAMRGRQQKEVGEQKEAVVEEYETIMVKKASKKNSTKQQP